MIIFKVGQQLSKYLSSLNNTITIGFVPTMGALHQGHLSLIAESKKKCQLTVCSIYVNPTQFSEISDLDAYPKPIEADIELLEMAGCDILYIPSTEDIYTDSKDFSFDLNGLDSRWEGPLRPGHFNGVLNICKRLFDLVKPSEVFFGQKDLQQCAVIRKLIRHEHSQIIFNQCPIIREKDGLAMSSRNIRLSDQARKQAPAISELMNAALLKVVDIKPEALGVWLTSQLNAIEGISVEYAVVVDTIDLKPAIDWNWPTALLVTCKVGGVRLLDNILIDSK